jgi:hypothetical protein
MDKRSQERKVRSLAQWSRASEAVLGKRRGVRRGVWRKTEDEEDRVLLSAS